MSLELGWGLGRRGALALCGTRRRNATRRLPRSSGLTPSPCFSLPTRGPCGERRLPNALPLGAHTEHRHAHVHRHAMQAPPGCPTQSPPVSLFLVYSYPLSVTMPPAGVTRWRPGADDDTLHSGVCPAWGRGRRWGSGPARGGVNNDPSAGSPTETLLRLLLPLDAGARRASGHAGARPPDNSPQHPIGRSDGRCVQRAGTHSARDH